MAPRMIQVLAIFSVLSTNLLTCQGQTPGPFKTTESYTINARLFNVTEDRDFLAGGLELAHLGLEWSKVCDKQLTTNTARVVCKMFNYTNGEGIARGRLGQSRGQMYPNKFDCSGSETGLSSCRIEARNISCTNSAGIMCFNDLEKVFEMQIVDGEMAPYQTKGRLEVRLKPLFNWGSVCDDGFSPKTATAACKYMGYKYGEAIVHRGWDRLFANSGVFGSSNETLLDEVICQEGQQFLSCNHNIWAEHDCLSHEDAGVMCMKTTVKLLSAVKADFHIGSVELFIPERDGWFEVCDDGWDNYDAQVVCKELDFQDGRALLKNSLGLVYYGSLTALGSVTNVSCEGHELDLASCKMNETSLCQFEGPVLNLAAVICYNHTVTEDELLDDARISSNNLSSDVGFLEIRHMAVWGRVCEDSTIFSNKIKDNETNVACRMIGYKGGKRLGQVNIFNEQHHIWLRGFSCNGTESSIAECKIPAWGSPATITCIGPLRVACYHQELTLSLREGSNQTGLLYLKYDNTEMEFCADTWKSTEANLACKELGFNGGRTWSKQGSRQNISTSTVVSDVSCLSADVSFYTCIKNKWSIPKAQCINGPAGVSCFRNVKIDPGYDDAGILQIYNSSTKVWSTICRNGFDDIDATVACRELGFTHGTLLPIVVFGFYSTRSGRTNVNCSGSETSFLDCPFSSNTISCTLSDYVSISCSNNISTGTFRLDKGLTDISETYGVLKIYQNNTWGYACDDLFAEIDAQAYCFKVGQALGYQFNDGLKFTSLREIPGPYFVSFANCTKDTNGQYVCNSRNYNCYVKRAIYLICAKDSAPKIHLVEDETRIFAGQLQINVNNARGVICANNWSDKEAQVVCKSLNSDYVAGSAILYNRSALPFYMSGIKCTGSEASLFECTNNGWRTINSTACGANSMEAGVVCYKKVFLKEQIVTKDSVSGKLSVVVNRVIRDVCFDDYFTFSLANLACQEMGYPYAALLKPSDINQISQFYMMKRITCSGTESSLTNCIYNIGSCYNGQVRLLCYKTEMNEVAGWSIIGYNGNIGQLRKNMFDKYVGVVCPVNFLDKEANATCAAHRQSNGVVLGSPEFLGNDKEIVWFGNISCSPSSPERPRLCVFERNVSSECFTKNYSAGVICFQRQDDFGLRLMNHDIETRMAGRVEIKIDGLWGTVCQKNNDSLQARTFCRQKGFKDGGLIPSRAKQNGNGTGPIYLKDVRCTNDDTLFLGCSNAGWRQVSNCTHEDDLEISCYSNERFHPDPESNFGAVSVVSNNDYKLVCSDNFSDLEATVFCSALGYQSGKSICCSALRMPTLNIGMSRVQCQGNERSLLDCNYVQSGGTFSCPSQKFASAACSHEIINDYMFSFENYDNGRLLINYYNVKGTVCADDFDLKDAQVACRHEGFSSGLAFISPALPNTFPMSWASHLQCTGSERSLDQCANFSLGRSSYCNSVANVICLRLNADSDIRVRLANGTSPNTGRLEIQINGTWGSVCHQQMVSVYSKEAPIICKELGFRGGQFLPPGMFGPSSGPIWLQGIKCNGNESKVKECQLERAVGEQPDCKTHVYDATVECFQNARLLNSKLDNNLRGPLQIYIKETEEWQYVCDSGITDREATLICKSLGQQYGKQQCCSAAGSYYYFVYNIKSLDQVSCPESATDFSNCTFLHGNCSSGHYSYVHCSQTPFGSENLAMQGMNTYVGQPQVTRFGISGNICNDRLSNTEAHIMCQEIGYLSGQLLHPGPLQLDGVIMLRGLNCTGSEKRISQCSYPSLSEAGACDSIKTARIICLQNSGTITFSINMDTSYNSKRAEIQFDGRTMVMESKGMTNLEASVFCQSISDMKYVSGTMYSHTITGRDQNVELLMTNIRCAGNEKTILQCSADFLPPYTITTQLAYVECHNGVELQQGFNSAVSAGILTLYNKALNESNAVCNDNFEENEAAVACRMLGYEHGIVHCCMSFGYSYKYIHFKNFRCNGTEKSLYDCKYESNQIRYRDFCNDRQDYVGLTCYNGTKSNDFNISIVSSSPTNPSSGLVRVTYLNTSGTVCNDGWDDADAKVVCKQMGYANGIAYSHYRSPYGVNENAGPFWISNVRCNGTELSIADCHHSGIGNVTTCSGHYAGVLCMGMSGIEFKLTGTDKPHYGRIEVAINGVWGSVCDRYWDLRDASVMCRQLGYVTGDVLSTHDLPPGQGPVWEIAPRCIGNESNIHDCPHQGWNTDDSSSCSTHYRDAGVFCYTSVRLGTGTGKSFSHGYVNVYKNGIWYKVCTNGFSDASARIVCQELGFYDGRALCCSAYDGSYEPRFEVIHPNITVQCTGDESSVQDCIKIEQCESSEYASVACFEAIDSINETDYYFNMNKDFEAAGRIDVTHLGVKGRICSSNWTDIDARVFCKGMNYSDGLAYYHSYADSYESASFIGPYWMSNFACIGNESSLSECKFNDRLHLGNCSGDHTAAAVCFNDTGIKYRLISNGLAQNNYGRIEMAIDATWGTICGDAWDSIDAHVACKNLNYTDGEVDESNKYGEGSGPIWLRDIQCTGNELALHACPHTGFDSHVVKSDGPLYPWLYDSCLYHHKDATVFCYQEAKLNQKIGMNTGALLYNHNNKWVHMCDSDTFNHSEAKVACKSLLLNFKDGVAIRGGRFGKSDAPIEISSITCMGSESSLSSCRVSAGGNCASNTYVSIACFNNILTDEDFKFSVRLGNDSIRTGDDHGILEIRENGAWGRICLKGFTDKEANVACREIGGFTGGVAYLHLFRNRHPMIWSTVSCNGDETSLLNCKHNSNVDIEDCHYLSNEAGILCYKGEGVKYRLNGGLNEKSGRVEIGIDGNYSSVCSGHWNSANARVFCRHLNYTDGIVSNTKNSNLTYLNTLVGFFICEGNESSLMTCINSGFDGGDGNYYCNEDAYTECFNEEVKITQIRLGDGQKSEGRVEVFVTGLNVWGTVCDDSWDKLDAQVVCRILGFQDGDVIISSTYSHGQGYILMDNVECNGTEKSIGDCKYPGINYHNCAHEEDAGVRCFNEKTTPISVTTVSTITTSSSKGTGVTTTTPTTASSPKAPSPNTSSTAAPPNTPSTAAPPNTSTGAATSEPTTIPDIGVHNQQSQDDTKNTKVIVAVCVTIFVAIVLIAVIVFLVFKYRSKQMFNPHKRFHDDDIVQSNDGSVAVANRMFDISNPDGGDPMNANSEIQIDHAGYVKFSKPSLDSELQPNAQEGFANPLFAVMQDPSDVGTESST